ncbi:MAG: hypothetical protein J5I28_09265 [Acidimicrobiales bacterium]|jgi:hypothetical protein|nr:hypothetical protein [Acidimicrobiales bacterium]HLV90047.1 hypothetical protein [Acidimicrobiia bacterium]
MSSILEKERTIRTDASPAKKSTLLLVAAIVAFTVGFGAVAGGVFGAWYTWDQAAVQNIVTPEDAAIPNAHVRGPLTMWAQSDIITHHQLDRTGGLYYSEMPRLVPQLDDAGNPVLDENGEQVMVPNADRASWLDATTLTTALNLGIISYALSAMAIAVGATLALVGYVFLRIRRRAVLL